MGKHKSHQTHSDTVNSTVKFVRLPHFQPVCLAIKDILISTFLNMGLCEAMKEISNIDKKPVDICKNVLALVDTATASSFVSLSSKHL